MNHQPIQKCWTFLRSIVINVRTTPRTTLNLNPRPFFHQNCQNIHFSRDLLNSSTVTLTPVPVVAAATSLNPKFSESSIPSSSSSSSLNENKKISENDDDKEDIKLHSTHLQFPAVLEIKIQNSNSVQELLQISTIPTALLKHACMILYRLGQLSLENDNKILESLLVDEKFIKMCNLVQRADYSQNPHLLFAAFQGLQKLGVLESSEIYQNLSVELKWGMRRCQIRYLIRAISLFAPSDTTTSSSINKKMDNVLDHKIDIVELAIHTLQRRWVEIISGSDFIAVFKILHLLDEETRGKLEDRVVEMVPTFVPSEMRQIFISLAGQKRRPTPLLRTLAYHFAKSLDSSNVKDLIELTYALNELTFADPVLMEKILNNICPDIPEIISPALISSLVTSLGQMRYKHKAIMRILDEWIAQHSNILRPFDCAAWLLTCSVLNHRTDNTKKFCEQFKSVLLSQKNSSSPMEWVNIVHSLLILDSHSNELLESVISPEVITSIGKMGSKSYKSKIKLLNINTVAKMSAMYKGPILDENLEQQWASSVLTTSDQKLGGVLLDTMNSFMPTEKYLTLNQKLQSGVFVDAVCMLNKNMQPISHDERKKSKSTPISVAVLIEGYSAMTLGSKEPTGHTILNRKLLEKLGYKVLSIPYTEFSASEKLIARAKYLEQKMKAIGN